MRAAMVIAALAMVCAGCGGGGTTPQAEPQLGGPRAGLTTTEQAAFARGKAIFEKRFTRSEGHGPDFNTSSCKSCHEIPVSGGSSPLYRNFLLVGNVDSGALTAVFDLGQLVARNFSYERVMREPIPAGTQVVAQRNAPPMFGVGLFATIPVADILANEDENDDDGDGVSGRVNLDEGAVGRFGYKAQEAGLEDFVRGPLFNHMGITSLPLSAALPLRAEAQVILPGSPRFDADGAPDPEMGFSDLVDLIEYTEKLAPPTPLPMDAQAERGKVVFNEVGCAKCHIENLVRNGTPVNAFTDLLIHDLGPANADGVVMGRATGSEFRTQPLWGARHHAPYMHDGSADTIRDAILAHGGEAESIRDAFTARTAADQDALIRYVETR